MRRYKVDQLVWLGEFICRVTQVTLDGRVIDLMGGPVLSDGSFNPERLRPLGIGGRIRVFLDKSQHFKRARVRKLFYNYKCPNCKHVSECIVVDE